ncbi:MAG: hypothetical protein NTW86_07390 [Candidatus Sumerlaeota bacterium]|nr:hypothetical protein [Candidatus Sumerlaeota bacterium]
MGRRQAACSGAGVVNVIRDCRGVAVFVGANDGSGDLAPAGAHSNIHSLRDHIERCPAPGIPVTPTRGLERGENALSLDESMTVAPQKRKRLAIDKPQPILLKDVDEVAQKG